MTIPAVKLNQGIHVMHLFYRVDRLRWAQLAAGESAQAGARVEACFAPGTLAPVFSYLSVTELSEYMPTEEEHRQMLIEQEKLPPDGETFKTRMAELNKRRAEYEHYRLYPELPDWEVMGFYPMSKRRNAGDNWYSLDFAARK